ncbi:hypothetical protein BDY19DRAFT_990771 [Irpex rosettiformis]|uniref:Uncharacterized protein n=1 Tax=Irpex rosettiformis TaxID=378272 RepID=A0ACB8UCI2_9APHY|nr:hypothetical protein BDY19DRAFT_990771 [Irpex rosettiformis]
MADPCALKTLLGTLTVGGAMPRQLYPQFKFGLFGPFSRRFLPISLLQSVDPDAFFQPIVSHYPYSRGFRDPRFPPTTSVYLWTCITTTSTTLCFQQSKYRPQLVYSLAWVTVNYPLLPSLWSVTQPGPLANAACLSQSHVIDAFTHP